MADNLTSKSTELHGPVVLVDGSSYLFRAFYALPDLRSSSGHPTGAIRGVINMLRRLAKDYPNSPLAVVFDAPGKTFRDDMFAEYKANRSAMPDDLRDLNRAANSHEMIKAMGLPQSAYPGVEADDVIGTYAAQATALQRETVISTGDKNMAQLVTPFVTLVNTMTETTMDADGVKEKFGVGPELIIDYLALMGDTVDNIPGVPKVGPKTAAKWLNEFGSLDELMARADEVKGKVGENLRNSLEQLPLSRALTAIKCDVALDLTFADLVPAAPNNAELRKFYKEFEFKSWLQELDSPDASDVSGSSEKQGPEPAVETDYDLILDQDHLQRWIALLEGQELIAVDTETTSIKYMEAELVGFSFAIVLVVQRIYPWLTIIQLRQTRSVWNRLCKALKPVLENPAIAKVGQNLKYDMSVLARYGVAIEGPIHDTMLQSYVLNSVATRHNMDALAGYYLDRKTIHFEDIAEKAKQLTFNQVPLETAADYAAEDADVTLQLHHCLLPQLQAQPRLLSVYTDIDMPLVRLLSQVERQGALVDGRMLKQHGAELADRLNELTQEVWALAGENFNLDSPKQLQTILYDKMDLPVLKKTPGGQPSTAEAVLVDLAQDYELPQLILTYRGLAKLKSTYADKLPLDIHQKPAVFMHPIIRQSPPPERLSSLLNLQNIPIRNAEGRRIRQAFVAPANSVVLAADYSQIELRIMAHLSGDRADGRLLKIRTFTEQRLLKYLDLLPRMSLMSNGVAPKRSTLV